MSQIGMDGIRILMEDVYETNLTVSCRIEFWLGCSGRKLNSATVKNTKKL